MPEQMTGRNIPSTPMELVIYLYDDKDHKYREAFSAVGDSGSVVTDIDNQTVGIINGSTGEEDNIDLTYATLNYSIEQCINVFPRLIFTHS
ncbi:hypothetical protein CPB83DRAFT_845763 [Crepidotus variabilis]|uniref:Uncharacterized protein n=1 Tax=Crepidotus variabilis TaxID=179855 RepID=A0A9P6EQJ8_9AGAR|nr:hypothetical protein CPB83DRAFT_845763 [Crepidotus variabilis]